MIIIHGDNTISSRNKLIEILKKANENNTLVERFNASQLDVPSLESKLQKTDLFGHSRMLVIEELHSQNRSKKLNTMIKMLANSSMNLCLWEKRQLTPSMLKKFKADQVFEFKLANSLFTWLDSLSPQESTKAKQIKLFQQAVKENDEYMCFIMLARQTRLLIQAASGGQIKGPFFVINKVNQQAKKFTLKRLLWLHNQLHELDKKVKISDNQIGLSQAVELTLLKL